MKLIVVGCGSVGAGLASVLSDTGHDVTVIDSDAGAFARLGRSFRGRSVVGAGLDRELLIDCGIEKTDGLAAVTASDEANAVIGRLAREVFRVPRVVARLYDPRKAAIYASLGLETLSPVTWGINRIADLLLYSELHVVTALGGGEVDIVEVLIPEALVGRALKELHMPGEAHAVAVTREGRTFLPAPELVLAKGDMVHLAMVSAAGQRVKSQLNLS